MRRRNFISGFVSGLTGLAAVAALSNAAFGQTYPNRPVVIVVPFAPERRSPTYLAKFIPEEIAAWAGPIKAARIQPEGAERTSVSEAGEGAPLSWLSPLPGSLRDPTSPTKGEVKRECRADLQRRHAIDLEVERSGPGVDEHEDATARLWGNSGRRRR